MADSSEFSSECSEVLSAHYLSVREDILEKQRARERQLTIWATVVVAIFGFSVDNDSNNGTRYLLLYAVPFFTFFSCAMYIYHDRVILFQLKWLTNEYTDFVQSQMGCTVPQWDGSAAGLEFLKNRMIAHRYFVVWALFAFALIGAGLLFAKILPYEDFEEIQIFRSMLYFYIFDVVIFFVVTYFLFRSNILRSKHSV